MSDCVRNLDTPPQLIKMELKQIVMAVLIFGLLIYIWTRENGKN